MKKTLDVERLVSWAFREELPKKPYPVSDFWARLIELGGRIDEGLAYSDQPGFLCEEPPHPDALLVSHAVAQLEEQEIDLDVSREILMGTLACWLPEDDRILRLSLRFQTRALISMHAQMGTRPEWDVGEIKPQRTLGRNGKPIVHGITPGGRYGDGALCPLQLNIDPLVIANARGEYAAWRAGLSTVKAQLESWTLADFKLTGPIAPPAPWITGPEPKPRILQTI